LDHQSEDKESKVRTFWLLCVCVCFVWVRKKEKLHQLVLSHLDTWQNS